ncbi:MAG: FadR/GntR family transcriptional regulator [Alphaproteobacteria bacterium]
MGGRIELQERGGSCARVLARRSLCGQVVHELGQQILSGKLPPLSLLPSEAECASSMAVSRTAFREAIKILTAKGLIESRTRVGTRVRAREFWNFLDPDVLAWLMAAEPRGRYVASLFELRRLVEPQAAALAATRATAADIRRLEAAYAKLELADDDGERWVAPDLDFHQTILRMTGNELIGTLGTLMQTAFAVTFHLSTDDPEGQRHALPLHGAVLAAIRGRDPDAACDAMTRLIDKSERDVKRAMAARKGRAR